MNWNAEDPKVVDRRLRGSKVGTRRKDLSKSVSNLIQNAASMLSLLDFAYLPYPNRRVSAIGECGTKLRRGLLRRQSPSRSPCRMPYASFSMKSEDENLISPRSYEVEV